MAVLVGVAVAIQQTSAFAAPHSSPPEQVSFATVVEQYGALVRNSPNSDGSLNVLFTADCGEVFPVVGSNGSWVQVAVSGRGAGPNFNPAARAWIGGARVHVGMSPVEVDCANAITYPILSTVIASVASGCLSLRHSPSRTAGFDQCVPNGHAFFVANGPIEVNGEDWFEVASLSGAGEGWVRAEFLQPECGC
jgi:hypothetical protein